ncbi:MAG: gliding motility lipoprotein GldD [Paludibacteraceae bacterium]|nr:gliding motility lipoprotein GldD [Paludibacteraceae bacterium]
MNRLNNLLIIGLLAALLCACSRPIPKPRGYFRIELKEKQYERYDEHQPYSFEYPSNISRVVRQNDHQDWFDIAYPRYNARIYCSYMPVKGNLYEVIEDSREFVYKHTIKADAITERPYENPEEQIYGILYEIKGNTASSVQFVLTDSTRHFLRGALYFNNKPNKDSLAPVIAYMKEDIVHLMETTQWK